MGFFAGLHYWFPKMFGRMYSERRALTACLLIFFGFNITFFSMFILGVQGMPRRWAEYPERFQPLHIASTAGSWLLALGTLLMFWNLFRSLSRGEPAPADPWGSKTLEWRTSSPPPTDNFEEIPLVTEWPYGFGKKEGEKG